MIKEVIVVEGKNDAAAVKRAVQADVIITSGFGITRQTLELIKKAQENQGVIILTDPDFMGEKIRKIIADRIKGVKHAFIPAEDALYQKDIGVENACPAAILKALEMAKAESADQSTEFGALDMAAYRLAGYPESSQRRRKLGAELGIGYTNAKQFVNRLNTYGISRAEFEAAFCKLFDKEQG